MPVCFCRPISPTHYGESNSNGLSHIQRLKARHECRDYLTGALVIEPHNAGALGLLGRVELDEGQLEKAHTLFNASLTHQPGQAQQYCNLGYWAIKSERPALAEQYFIQALECDRQSAAAFCGVAHSKRLQGWQELTADADFYSLGGCRDRWFRPQDTTQLKELMAMVSNEVEWKLVKARDEDGHSLATGPVQKQIQAEALGSEVQSLMG